MDGKERQQILDYVTKVRRALHKIPELSDEEYATSDFLKKELKGMGYEVKKIHTGLYTDILGKDEGMRIALRCDMDALPITEKNDIDFKAEKNMHACGHDGHMAIVLGVAKMLKTHRPACSVRLIFQFGEEGEGGAAKMIEGGVIDGVDEIYAFHLCPELPKGKMASCEGAMFAGTVEFDVKVKGLSAHCADREKGIDALAAIAEILTAKKKIEAKHKGTLLHFGKVESGSARNVVAGSGNILCSLRYFDKTAADSVLNELQEVLKTADKKHGTKSEIVVKTVYPPLVNSPYALKKLMSVAKVEKCKPRYTAEDFAFYTREIDGCMAWLGVKDENHFSPLHSDTFGFDESALVLGVETMLRLVGALE